MTSLLCTCDPEHPACIDPRRPEGHLWEECQNLPDCHALERCHGCQAWGDLSQEEAQALTIDRRTLAQALVKVASWHHARTEALAAAKAVTQWAIDARKGEPEAMTEHMANVAIGAFIARLSENQGERAGLRAAILAALDGTFSPEHMPAPPAHEQAASYDTEGMPNGITGQPSQATGAQGGQASNGNGTKPEPVIYPGAAKRKHRAKAKLKLVKPTPRLCQWCGRTLPPACGVTPATARTHAE